MTPARPAPSPTRLRRFWAVGLIAAIALIAGLVAGASHESGDQKVADRWAADWSRADYAGMYRLISAERGPRVSEAVFAHPHEAAANTATATSVLLGSPHKVSGAYVLPVVVRTRIFGT